LTNKQKGGYCDKQWVISVPAESILKGDNIMGTFYRRLPYEFNLEREIKAYIYERTIHFIGNDMEFLSGILKCYYTDNRHA
jgi:hypothetical protein